MSASVQSLKFTRTASAVNARIDERLRRWRILPPVKAPEKRGPRRSYDFPQEIGVSATFSCAPGRPYDLLRNAAILYGKRRGYRFTTRFDREKEFLTVTRVA